MVLKRTDIKKRGVCGRSLSSLSTDPASKLDVLGHDGDPLSMDGAQVSVLEETNEVSLAGFLKSSNSRALEPQVGLEILGNLTDKPLEWELADEELSGLLVTTDLTESDCSGSVTMGFLYSSGGWGALTGGFGGKLFTWSLSSG